MAFDCKVYQYDDKAERWQLRATYADPIAAHVDGDGIAIPASDFAGPSITDIDAPRAAAAAVRSALRTKRITPDFNVEKGAWVRVLVTNFVGDTRGFDVPLCIEVECVSALDSGATSQLADPLRRNA